MRVKEAEDFDRVVPGQIIIAAGEFHLTLKEDAKGYYIRSQRGEKVSGHCPSVDVMFDSVAKTAGKNAVGVILTGMGADGAKGIKFLKDTGAYTIGQDKETCVVYGMPMEAYKIGGISRQLPLDQIGSEVIYQVNKIK
jgi:two-component system chemotaxis response regulator CheB